MGDWNINYDFLWGIGSGIGLSVAAWVIYKPNVFSIRNPVTMHMLREDVTPSSPSVPLQLTLPFDSAEVSVAPSVDNVAAVAPVTVTPTNVTMTLAPTMLPRPSRRGRPKSTSSTQKKKSTSTAKSVRRPSPKPKRKQSRFAVARIFRRLMSVR